MCPSASAVMPPTCPMIQLFGSGFGQVASTAKVGTSPAGALCTDSGVPISKVTAAQAAMVLVKRWMAGIERARWFIAMMGSSLDFIDGFFPLGAQSIAGRGGCQLRGGYAAGYKFHRHSGAMRSIELR